MSSIVTVVLSNVLVGAATVNSVSEKQDACNLRVKATDSYTDQNGQLVEKEEWHDVVVFGKKGSFDKRVKTAWAPGNSVDITADWVTHKKTEKDGNVYTNTAFQARKIQVVRWKQSESNGAPAPQPVAQPAAQPAQQQAPAAMAGMPEGLDDDIPF